MDANGNGGDTPLEYATIQILPSENRYEAYTCNDSEIEKVGVGVLEKLLPHLPGLDNLYTQGSNVDYKLQPPNNLNSVHWFTKSTFTRFLHLVSSTELVDTAKGIEGEISLLEETRKFHLSQYAQGHQDRIQSSKKDMSNSEDGLVASKFEVNNSSSDSSKNELLRAMDSRLTALRSELVAAFNQAVGETCSYKEIAHLVKFSEIFGATDVKNFLHKFLELSQKSQVANLSDDEKSLSTFASMSDRIIKTDGNNQSKPLSSETPVKYAVSPAKAAQVERQSSTESEESSDSSDEIQTSAERSRALIRSASPRRSASPMRRVQIGRGGSRRASALTIKSLIPAREKMWSQTDVASEDSKEEGSGQTKKPENNVQRMSVQDAINLFERKQRDQIPAVPIRNSLTSISLGANKAVLRRWSSGMGESSYQCQSQNTSEDPVPEPRDNVVDNDIMGSSAEVNLEPDTRTEAQNIDETFGANVERLEERSSSPIDVHVVTDIIQEEEANGRSKSSAEWSRKKEAELNQMFKRMMENQPVSRSKPQAKVRQNLSPEHRSGFYDHYKEKRDKKLRGENAGKRTEKEEKFRAMQKILDERKAEVASKKVNNLCKKDPPTKALNSTKSSQKLQNFPSQPAKTKDTAKETTRPSGAKKISSRTSPLPAARKSWPSTPSPRTRAPSPAKTSGGISSAGTMPTSQKPQSSQSAPRVSPKVESSQPQRRNVNPTQANKRGSMSVNEKQQQKMMTSNKTTRTKVAAAGGGDSSGVVPAKPSLYNKATKKSTVVPLESKPFLRKGSGLASTTGVVNKIKTSKLEVPLRNTENSIDAQESDIIVNASVSVNEYHDQSFTSLDHSDDANQPETQVNGHQKCDVIESVDELAPDFEEGLKNIDGSSQGVEESIISPTAWVEIEEQQNLPDQCDDQTGEIGSSACIAPVESASPRVRHSLSQMLQEESSEADTTEWGNAENPPAMVYQKDAPKGLKRLLKFARKSKGDANISGWSSSSVFSEGEDDTEDSKVYNKKNADNLLLKAALHAKNYEHNLDAHELPSGTRSFFSLSAFRGSKPSDMKLRQS
ncbi:uncharacterized protein LOC120213105 isoform X2 [Hibiscus syriacus]|uniref:uncharacterized protein LOC120213105 isoform X2 n=1 Tax=Hibiscus syriacus TaxID=106335 RepID=UPI00192439D8|nr:uncharacterized protein LOC120213105 isoform X2 [Hibiscus syriacus]